jgi:hypothetical protein
LIQLEEYPEAVVNCDFALHFKPGNGKALIRKAKALLKLDRAAEAKACRAVALSYLKPNDPELWEVGSMLGLNEGVPPPQAEEEKPADASPEKGKEEEEPEAEAAPEPVAPKTLSPRHAAPPGTVAAVSSLADAAGRGRGSLGRSPSGAPGAVRTPIGTPSPGRKHLEDGGDEGSPRETPLSPGAVKKGLPVPPGGLTGPRASGGALKKPSTPAPVAPKPKRAASKMDALDVNLDYAHMADSELPPLPAEPPTIDEDMLRWQQYQRLKTEYKDRNLEPKFA